MQPHRILVLYGTTRGLTARIARRIAERLVAAGHRVTLADAGDVPRGVTPSAYEGVIVGSSVTFGRHQRSVERFVTRHRGTLATRPTAFFSVSASAAGTTSEDAAAAQRYVDEFVEDTAWRPWQTVRIAGAIAYTQYNVLLRWIMRRIAVKAGAPTDTSRDHVLTDWALVDRLADEFAAILEHPIESRTEIDAGRVLVAT